MTQSKSSITSLYFIIIYFFWPIFLSNSILEHFKRKNWKAFNFYKKVKKGIELLLLHNVLYKVYFMSVYLLRCKLYFKLIDTINLQSVSFHYI